MDNSKSPILNNPYEEPQYHYDATLDGRLDYTKIIEGRRPYTSNLNVLPGSRQNNMFGASDFDPDDDETAKFINQIRAVVKDWREKEYPQVTRVTRDLLNFWFCNPEREMNRSLFFCQYSRI